MRQLFWGIKADESSSYPVPPRLIIGWYTLPLYGSTHLYKKRNGSVYKEINPKWRQINILPAKCSRELGACFSLFVFGEWRTVIHGAERSTIVFSGGDVSHEVASPICLEQHSQFTFTNKKDKEQGLEKMLKLMRHESVSRFSCLFGDVANKFLDQVLVEGSTFEPRTSSGHGSIGASLSMHKLKFYTMALVEGPVLNFSLDAIQQETRVEQLSDRQKREVILSQMKSIQEEFQIRNFRCIKRRAIKTGADFDQMLLNHVNNMRAKLDVEKSKDHTQSPSCDEDVICESAFRKVVKPVDNPFKIDLGLYLPTKSGQSSLLQMLLVNNNDQSISQDETIKDITGMLWLALDIGNAWTQMALLLLSRDPKIYAEIRNEIDDLESHGTDIMFEDHIFSRLVHLDAIVFEAIRLCPQFCGGLWKVNSTVEMENDEVQIPSASRIIVNAEEDPFDVTDAIGKLPQYLGESYPNKYLYGFLPLNGAEVPIMVLQTKALIAAVIKKCNLVEIKKCNDVSTDTMTKDLADRCISLSLENSGTMNETNDRSASISWSESRSWYEATPFPRSRQTIALRKRHC